MSAARAVAIAAAMAVSAIASAHPMATSLDDVIKTSPDVVVATFVGPAHPGTESLAVKLHVESALRGKKSGDLVVTTAGGHVYFKPGTRVVAFLSKTGEWQFSGEAPDGLTLDDAIQLRGFYDFDAHLVAPSLVTFGQLRDRFAGKPIAWHFEGPLEVLSNDGAKVIDSPWTLSVNGTENLPATVLGFTAVDVPPPQLSVGGWDASVSVSWNRGWPRPLVILGKVTGHRDDVLLVKFRLAMPDLFHTADIARYLVDPKAAHANYRMRIEWRDGGGAWTVALDEGLLVVTDDKGGKFDWSESEIRSPHPHIGTLMLGPGVPGALLDGDSDDRVMAQEVLRGPIAVTLGRRHGKLELVELSLDR